MEHYLQEKTDKLIQHLTLLIFFNGLVTSANREQIETISSVEIGCQLITFQ